MATAKKTAKAPAKKTVGPAKAGGKKKAAKVKAGVKTKPKTAKAPAGKTVKAKTTAAVRGKAKPKAAKPAAPAKKAVRPAQAKVAAKKVVPKKHPAAAKTGAPALKKKPAVPKKAVVSKPETRAAVSAAPAAEKKGSAGTAHAEERLRELRKMLITKREGILKEAKQEIAKYVSGENRQLVDTAIDEGDWAVVDISEDISLKRLSSHRQLLLDIDECLRKIREGTYGICEECGEEISEKRLNVIPTASLCIDCKENKERMAAFEHEAEM
jgi:DnaK suppressor protein